MSHIGTLPGEMCSVSISAHCIKNKIHYTDRPRSGGGLRGLVDRFSKASRNRMLEKVSEMDFSNYQVFFVTLTYPRRFPDCHVVKKHRRAFEMRFVRKFPGGGFIWKQELQKRGAPHFHVIAWVPSGSCGDFRSFCLNSWVDIVDDPFQRDHHRRFGVDVTEMQSRRGVMSYTSKYCAKETDGFYPGRCWGICGTRPVVKVCFRMPTKIFNAFYHHWLVERGRFLDGMTYSRIFEEDVFLQWESWIDQICKFYPSSLYALKAPRNDFAPKGVIDSSPALLPGGAEVFLFAGFSIEKV